MSEYAARPKTPRPSPIGSWLATAGVAIVIGIGFVFSVITLVIAAIFCLFFFAASSLVAVCTGRRRRKPAPSVYRTADGDSELLDLDGIHPANSPLMIVSR